MEILEIETTNERGDQKRPYLKPFASVMALDYLEGVLVVLSWYDGHSSENFNVREQDPKGDGKLSKEFNISFQDIWEDGDVNEEEY